MVEAPVAGDSLVECALKVLQCPDPWQKAEYTYATVRMWRDGTIQRVRPLNWQHLKAPDRPARSDDKVRVCAPGEAPRRGRGGTLASRQALLHSAVHIENWAVDLSWDVVARFGLQASHYMLPRQFFDDFVTVAEDECRHFTALAKRLQEVGSHYGAFVVHDGLWESAASTAHSLPARLAVEHCVHEARGLDVLPATIAKFANNGDTESAALLRDVVYPEEVNHCAAGVRWIRYLYDVAHGRRPPAPPADEPAAPAGAAATGGRDGSASLGAGASADSGLGPECSNLAALSLEHSGGGGGVGGEGDGARCRPAEGVEGHPTRPAEEPSCGDGNGGGGGGGGCCAASGSGGLSWAEDARQYGSVEEWFHSLVRSHFWGALKPPFNEEARAKAGFGPEWYLPLATPAPATQTQPAVQPTEGAGPQAQAAASGGANGRGAPVGAEAGAQGAAV